MNGIVLKDIDKLFPSSGIQANRKARLNISAGEIHAIIGENGAGKTTLMKILAGLEKPDSGSISIDGTPVAFKNPGAAAKVGIGMVHQHFMTIPGFSVAENIVFGMEPRVGGIFIDAKALIDKAGDTIRRFGFSLDPRKPADELTVGERQQVEILRQLYRDCEFLILDEPTSVLTEQEIHSLFSTLRRLKEQGRTIVIITHKVKEVKELSDVVTVMRGGSTIGRFVTSKISEYDLSSLMMGSSNPIEVPRRSPVPATAQPVLVLTHVSIRKRLHGKAILDKISIAVHRGEICGICAVSGNGLSELEDLLAGMAKPTEGSIIFDGKPYPRLRRAPWLPGGIGYVPSNRMRRGSCAGKTVSENFMALDRSAFFPHGFLDKNAGQKAAEKAIHEFSIKAEPGSRIEELSGGNIQKMILARELSDPPPWLSILCEPTWGLDMASTDFVYNRILGQREKGSAILLMSSNLDEIMALSDRIIVLHKGRVVASETNGIGTTREALGALMLGLGHV